MATGLTGITDYLLTQSWQIALLVLVVAAVNLALRNRSAHVRYLLWLIVLAKCLVPPFYAVPLAILPQQEQAEPAAMAPLAYAPPLEREATGPMMTEPAELSSIALEMPSSAVERGRRIISVREWLGIGWMVGACAFLAFNLLRALRANLWLWRRRKALPAELRRNIENLFSAHGVQSFPDVWLVEGFNQPFVWGLVRGSIYLPMDFLSINRPEHQRSVLGHELSHVLRFDAAVNILQVIAQAIFWFHPLIWWANRKIRQEREKCCDEMAVARLHTSPRDYSTAILETLAAMHKQTRPVPSLAVAGPVKNIEERIKTMLRPGKRFYKHPSLVTAIVVLLVALLTVPTALVLTARAETKSTTEQNPAPVRSLIGPAAAGNLEEVKSLISAGADVNERGVWGTTPLHYASMEGHVEVAKLLISKGAYVNAPDGLDAMTPLHWAAGRGDKQTVEVLLSEGADINARNKGGRTPLFEAMKSSAADRKEIVELLVAKGAKVPALHLAAYMGDMEKVRKCLQDGTDINSQEDFCCTALHAAANGGRKDVAEFLISRGADIDAKDTSGMTPLYYAAMHNYEDIADLLLAKGADVDAKDASNWTLLNYAMWDQSDNAIRLLISKGANINAKDINGFCMLTWAIWWGGQDTVELLISKGADVNAEDNAGCTPLYWAAGRKDLVELLTAKGATISTIHLASRLGDLAKVKSLVEEGTDVNSKGKGSGDETPLFPAVRADNTDAAKFLIAKGADVNAKDKNGQTPLHEACEHGRRDMVELLIVEGADVNAKDNDGVTPLHIMFLTGRARLDVAELLIAKGADVNAKETSTGRTPLYRAVEIGHTQIVGFLIDKGADVNTKDNEGQTPLHGACKLGYKQMVELLIAKGADINAKDNKGQTALSLANEQGRTEIVELLKKRGAKE